MADSFVWDALYVEKLQIPTGDAPFLPCLRPAAASDIYYQLGIVIPFAVFAPPLRIAPMRISPGSTGRIGYTCITSFGHVLLKDTTTKQVKVQLLILVHGYVRDLS
jgi:hypothetical protein